MKIEITPIGPGFYTHNVMCWLCQKNKAIYNAYPNWVFEPCFDCRVKYDLKPLKRNIRLRWNIGRGKR